MRTFPSLASSASAASYASPPRRRRRKKASPCRLPKVSSFYDGAAQAAPTQPGLRGLSDYKERLGAQRRERLVAQRVADQPGLVDRETLARRPHRRTQPIEAIEAASKTFDLQRFVNREMLDSFQGRPYSPESFKVQCRKALHLNFRRSEIDELYQEFDSDGNGTIDGAEFVANFARLGFEARERDANDLIAAKWKRDNAAKKGLAARRERLLPSFALAPNDDEVMAAFALFDRDGSGAVSHAEVRQILSYVGKGDTNDPETRDLAAAAEALDDVRCETLAACEMRGVTGRGSKLDAFAEHFVGKFRICDLYGQCRKALGLRLDARLLSALLAALGGVDPKTKLVEGERFVKLLVGWLNDHRDHLRDANDVAKRKRRATMHKLVSEKRTIRGTDPWSAEGWIGR